MNYNVQNPNSTANDLVDQRQSDIEQLAQYMNFTTSTIPNSNGQIQVTALGRQLKPGDAREQDQRGRRRDKFTGTGFTAGIPATTLWAHRRLAPG